MAYDVNSIGLVNISGSIFNDDIRWENSEGIHIGFGGTGMLTIEGDFTTASSCILEIEVDNQGHHDQLVVTGNAQLNGGTVKVISTEIITDPVTFTILSANQVSGAFDVLNIALLQTSISDVCTGLGYSADSVNIRIQAWDFDDPRVASSSNQKSLGQALNQIADNGGNSITTTLQQVETVQELQTVYNQLSGITSVATTPVAAAGTRQFISTVVQHLNQVHSGGAQAKQPSYWTLDDTHFHFDESQGFSTPAPVVQAQYDDTDNSAPAWNFGERAMASGGSGKVMTLCS